MGCSFWLYGDGTCGTCKRQGGWGDLMSLQGRNLKKTRCSLTSLSAGVKREAELAGELVPAKTSKKQKTSKVQKVSRPSMKKTSAKSPGASVKASPAVKAEPAAVQVVGPAAGIVDDAPQLWQISHSTFKRRFRQVPVSSMISWCTSILIQALYQLYGQI